MIRVRINSKGGRVGPLWWINSDTRERFDPYFGPYSKWGEWGVGVPFWADKNTLYNIDNIRAILAQQIEKKRQSLEKMHAND